MAIVDIIIFLLVGAFIVSRFMGFKLPTAPKQPRKGRGRAGQSRGQKRAGSGDVLDFPKVPKGGEDLTVGGEDEGTYVPLPAQELSGIEAIKAADPDFKTASFLKGAKAAYGFYYDRYNAKDDEALSNLLAPILLNDTIEVFNALDDKGHTPDTVIEKIEKATIADARLNGQTMLIDVQFTALQSHNMRTKTGKCVGKEKPVKTVKSLWTFARSAADADPNWDLQMIQKAS